MAAKVFFSYAHADEALRDQLAKQLVVMQRNGLISAWHDRQIDAGKDLDPAISEALETSDIVLCLVSPDFLASHYCYEREMKRALERRRTGECEVIPVILRPCPWTDTPLGGLRATPSDGNPVTKFSNQDEAFLNIARDIQRVVKTVRTSRSAGAVDEPPQSHVQAAGPAGPRRAGPAPEPPAARLPKTRIRRTFKDADKDAFLESAFETVVSFVEDAAKGLRTEPSHIEARFRRIDARSFSVSIYEDGRRVAAGSVWYGNGMGNGIYFASSPDVTRGSFNEMLSVADDGFELHLKTLGVSMRGNAKERMSAQDAAEYLWEMILGPLIR